jgi:hypothetical protein
MGRKIEEGERERERRSFEHVAGRSITTGRGKGEGFFFFTSVPPLLHGRRDSSFSSFSSTTCSLDALQGVGGGGALSPWCCVRIYPLTSPSTVERHAMKLSLVMLLCHLAILGSLWFLCTWHMKWTRDGVVYVSLRISDLKILIGFLLSALLETYIRSFFWVYIFVTDKYEPQFPWCSILTKCVFAYNSSYKIICAL